MSDERDILDDWHGFAFSDEGEKYLLEYAAVLLRVLSDPAHPARDRKSLHESAKQVAAVLDGVLEKWEGGELLHFEHALGLQRRPRWQRDAALREYRYKHLAAQLVREQRQSGVTTDQVFRVVYELGLLPPEIGESKIRDWYYECKRALPELYDFPGLDP